MQDQYHPEADDEIEIEAIGIEVDSQPIELYKVLKIANVVSGGGEAKYAIAEGYVAVNGELETRKRCKVYDGDLIEFNGEYYLVICDQPVEESIPELAIKAVPAKSANKIPNKQSTSKPGRLAEKKKSKSTKKPNSNKPNANKADKKGATIEASADGGRSRIHFG